ncbi:uncharacterized protein LOC133832194 [Humulus lupulus]|uniref:uncharacterized protein LOC133832194 n=1 Tax=Humulus lupulus TaxID=3486 RepID=UPI002B4118CE|nr:uncharacterized protein LOC133832194 [Humulus lupulus]
MHMLRRRRQFYPGAYRQDGVVMNIMFSQVVPTRYDAYQNAKEADKKMFLWDSYVISMITGIDNQFLASWKGVDTVYWCQNYLQAHWFAVEASISTWTLNVYDSDVTVISDKQLQSFMKSWSTLFPSLLLQSQLFKDDPRLTIPPGAKRCKEFNVHRMPVDSVPQTKVSGDCGVYAIKHIEHLLGRLPLDTICDDNMELFRNKWTVDLWYQEYMSVVVAHSHGGDGAGDPHSDPTRVPTFCERLLQKEEVGLNPKNFSNSSMTIKVRWLYNLSVPDEHKIRLMQKIEFMARSKASAANREKKKYPSLHVSTSYVSARFKKMNLQTNELPNIIDMFHDIHNHPTRGWVNTNANDSYEVPLSMRHRLSQRYLVNVVATTDVLDAS